MISFFRSKSWIPYLPIVAAPFLLFGIPLITGKVLYWGTPALQFIPWREFAYAQLDHGVFPLWNSLNGMGAPLLANYQTAFYYPPSWILIIGHWIAGAPGVAWVYTLLVPVHLALAGIGMALLLKSIGIKQVGQVIAGLTFGMSGYFVARGGFFSMIWAGAWMPWVLWAASGIGSPFSNVRDRKRWIWFVMITAFMLLAGHAQLSWYILLFAGAWTFLGSWFNQGFKQAIISAAIFIGLCFAASVLSAVQLVPTLEYLLQSQRAGAYEYTQATTYSFWPWRLLAFLNPDLFGNPGLGNYWGYAAYWEDAIYIGIIPLFLAVRTLWTIWVKPQKSHRYGIMFLWVVILIGTVFALGSNTPIFPWLFKHIPSFNLFQAPARWMIWTVTALCILAGLSTSEWSRPIGRRRFVLNLATFGCVAILVGAGIASQLLTGIKSSLLFGFMYFAVVSLFAGLLALWAPSSESTLGRYWFPAIVIVIGLDLIGASLFLNPFIQNNFYEQQPGIKSNLLDTTGNTYISSQDEYGLKFGRYLKFTDTRWTDDFNTIRHTFMPNLNLLDGLGSANNFDPLVPARYAIWMEKIDSLDPADREQVLQFMGVSAWIHPESNASSAVTIQNIMPDEIIQIYHCVEQVESADIALTRTIENILKKDNLTAQCIIVEQFAGGNSDKPAEKLLITNLEQDYDRLKFRVASDSTVWLGIAQTWYPGWQVIVDGQVQSVYHANYIFSGFPVAAGEHEVQFYYRPLSFIIGAGLSLTSIILLIVIVILLIRRNKKSLLVNKQNA